MTYDIVRGDIVIDRFEDLEGAESYIRDWIPYVGNEMRVVQSENDFDHADGQSRAE